MRVLAAGLISLLLVVGSKMGAPFLFSIAAFPILAICAVQGMGTGALLLLLVAVAAGALFREGEPWIGLSFLCVHAPATLIAGILARRQKPAFVSIFWAWILTGLSLLGTVLALNHWSLQQASLFLQGLWRDFFYQFFSQAQALDLQGLEKALRIFLSQMWGWQALGIGLYAFLNYALAAAFSRRISSVSLPQILPFTHWRWSEPLIFVFLAAGFLLLAGRLWTGPFLLATGENLMLPVAALYSLSGVSLAVYFLRVRWLTPFLVLPLIFPPWAALTFFAGILDVWANFRERKWNENEESLTP